ncbi:hypothetical protein LSG31_21655 [Fodinisporobacter ferrooxydans]|uniref:Phage protein n=1 Tax=Fodinisporobacter ferrooxydans TaxID=2901836 RepID=A0ABY4CLY2_9BACL|nr:hypothetical protein LSG31_21655 [Alicyclobacillaceae bacterium MYW30-H2]
MLVDLQQRCLQFEHPLEKAEGRIKMKLYVKRDDQTNIERARIEMDKSEELALLQLALRFAVEKFEEYAGDFPTEQEQQYLEMYRLLYANLETELPWEEFSESK